MELGCLVVGTHHVISLYIYTYIYNQQLSSATQRDQETSKVSFIFVRFSELQSLMEVMETNAARDVNIRCDVILTNQVMRITSSK